MNVRFVGPLASLSSGARAVILGRARAEEDAAVEGRVRAILGRVRREGDAALYALARELDGVDLRSLEVPKGRVERALASLDGGVRRGLERAVKNLETVHRAFLPSPVEVESEPGVLVGRRPDPLAAVGVYAPGGRAAYPSSVLMGVVPARVAGVKEIIVCSPPSPDGEPSPVVLAAAAVARATRVFAAGGAQAVAAMAFGTETVPRVERVVGPGNAYVAEAKRQIAGVCGIDAPAGPSEVLIIADGGPEHVARELVAQAEHDPEASCVALVLGESLAEQTLNALSAIDLRPEKRDIVLAALGSRGALLSLSSLDEAWGFAADYAAEHLMLLVNDPEAALPHVRHAGTVFFGPGASVAFGDYLTGANHVLPTAGAARSYSGLSTLDFMRFTTYQRIGRDAAAGLSADTALLADAEGLVHHAEAARAFSRGGPK